MQDQGSNSNVIERSNGVPVNASGDHHNGHPEGAGQMDEQTRAILNSDAPIRYQDLLAEDGELSLPPAGANSSRNPGQTYSGASFQYFLHNSNNAASAVQKSSRNNQRRPAGSSISNPIVISSETSDQVLGDDGSTADSALPDGSRLPCKRKVFLGESSQSGERGAGSRHGQGVNAPENSGGNRNISSADHQNRYHPAHLGARIIVGPNSCPVHWGAFVDHAGGAGEGASHQDPNMVGQANYDPLQRNIRLRRSSITGHDHQHDVVDPPNVARSTNTSHPPAVSINPLGHLTNGRLTIPVFQLNAPPGAQIAVVSQPFQLNRVRAPIPNISSNSNIAVDQGSSMRHHHHHHRQDTSNVNFGNGSMPPPQAAGFNFANGTFAGHHFSRFINGSAGSSSSHSHWPFQGGMMEFNQQTGHHQFCPMSPSATRLVEEALRGFNARSVRPMPHSRSADQRQSPDNLMRHLTDADRSRLLCEVFWHALMVDNEDLLIINGPGFQGVPHYLHDYMGVNPDDMSYEDMVALQGNIGNVRAGLSENAILFHLKRRKFQVRAVHLSREEEEACCICQEEYEEGEEMGKLNCGHDFHFNCIKQWLVEKNECPICKMKGLDA